LDWAGKAYGWTALGPLALLATAIVLGVLFVVVEMRTEEPIIPMRLFRNEIFAIGNLYTFISGVAMFGAIIFLPFYLQIVKGLTPTMSGLAMLPMVLGLLGSSIASGRAITRTGRYKIFPIAGAAIQVVALFFFSRLEVDTSFLQLGLIQLAFGIGLGCTMQTITTAVQNSVEFRDLGVATSATTFFRQMGGTIGAAAFGAILSNRLAVHLIDQLGPVAQGAQQQGAVDVNNIEAIQRLPDAIRIPVLHAFTNALDDLFLIAIPLVSVALLVSFFLKEVPLRTGRRTPADAAVADTGPAEALSAGL
ncbi:MAG: MFS transporter, partial [Chloroflexota bacterium]|nr:MFS transporter [Chloroflexota bacterium]